MSEIDHIFASSSKGKSIPTPPANSSANKPKKKKKRKNTKLPLPEITPPTSSKKRPLPETIVDTSHKLSGPSKRHKSHDANPKLDKLVKIGTVVDPAFKDSRGAGDRRKTEEGWHVYKEDELGIGDEGGDTPLCPFDCECCF